MPVQKGVALNPNGYNGKEKFGYRAKGKIQTSLDKAIDLLGKDTIGSNGATRLSELIAAKLESDVIGTLKALTGLLPKQVSVDVQHSTSALQMSDEQLLEIIKSRALPAEKVIEGQLIEPEQDKIENMVNIHTEDHF